VQQPEPLDQGLRERCQAWTDLNHGVAGSWINGTNNAVNNARVGQKMLTKSFASNVFHER
jgi:hypothetical protein